MLLLWFLVSGWLASTTVLAVHATQQGVAIVTFNRQLTPTYVQLLEETLGYKCVQYVPPNSLRLYLTDTILTNLLSRCYQDIVRIEYATDQDRCSPLLENVQHSYELVQSAAVGIGEGPVAIDLLSDTVILEYIDLCVQLHFGALIDASIQEIQATLNAHIEHVHNYTLERFCDISFVVRVRAPDVLNVTRMLLEFPQVDYILPHYPVITTNLFANGVAQTFEHTPDTSLEAADACTDCTIYWDDGLRGTGQLVGVSDTGISTNMCYFYDGAHAVPFTTSKSVPADTGHRKIAAYWKYRDGIDSNGHGSHVVGAILGQAATNNSGVAADDFNGLAYEARVVFVDGQSGTGGLFIPAPYDTELLQFVYNAGARIHSGSWGIADYVYSDEDRRIDDFCYKHRDFIAVFAAGNNGDTRGPSSILSPALAKNVIAVAANMNGYAAYSAAGGTPAYSSSTYNYSWTASFSSRGGTNMNVRWMKPDIAASGGQYRLSANAKGPTSCSSLLSCLALMAGTSQGTPEIAAMCTLIRQYFIDGRYVSTPVTPMSSLVRAILYTSGEYSVGIYPNRNMNSVIDSSYQPYGAGYIDGHGRATLHNVLPTSAPAYDTELAVLSNEDADSIFTASGQVRRYCVAIGSSAVSSKRVGIGLVYTDYPSTYGSSVTIINDVDLRVNIVSSSNVIIDTVYPNRLGTTDHSSTSEIVKFTLDANTFIELDVYGYNIAFGNQDYSLIVTADHTIRVNGVPVTGLSVAYTTDANTHCSKCSDNSFAFTCATTTMPTAVPTQFPTSFPTRLPTPIPTAGNTLTVNPTSFPTRAPTRLPTATPTTSGPTLVPTVLPTSIPTRTPTRTPTALPTPNPTALCPFTSYEWLSILAADPSSYVDANTDVICCQTFDSIARNALNGSRSLDPLFSDLSYEVIAAILNNRYKHVGENEIIISLATSILSASCAHGIQDELTTALHYYTILKNTNDYCKQSNNVLPQTCANIQEQYNAYYCSGHGVFSPDTECRCNLWREDYDCRHKYCGLKGVSVDDQCYCFLGSTGSHCGLCASSLYTGYSYICMGLVPDALPAELTGYTHILELVADSTVDARLQGSYYTSTTKTADALPGTIGLDCWCLPYEMQLKYGNYITHAERVSAALDLLKTREIIRVIASSTFQSGPVPTPRPTTATTTLPIPLPTPFLPSAANSLSITHTVVVATVIVLGIM